MKTTYIFSLIATLFFASNAMACMCDEGMRAPEKLAAAADKAAVIFIGKLEGVFWYGKPITLRTKQPDGTILEINDVIPKSAKRRPYDPKLGIGLPVEVEFSVQQKFKDQFGYIQNNKIVLKDINYGWCGFPLEKGGTYVVYGRKEKNGNAIYASRCSRTKLLSESKEDVEYLNRNFKEE